MSTPFRFGGFDDVRFEMLASSAGYNAYEAWGRWCKAGSECTNRGTRVISEAMAVAFFGSVDALLTAELGRRVLAGIELDLEEGSIEWLGELKAKRQKAGKARAEMPRDAKGRLLPAQHTTTTRPAHAGALDQHTPPPSSALDLDPVLPEQGEPLDLKPPGRERSRRKPATPLPTDWQPRQEDNELQEPQLSTELRKFRNHAAANDWRKVDWNATWKNWQIKAREFAQRRDPHRASIGSAAPRADHGVSMLTGSEVFR